MSAGNQPHRILLIRLSSIGDIVLTTALVEALRRLPEPPQVDFLTKAKFASLLHEHPGIARVIQLPDDTSFTDLFRIRREIRVSNYACILDLHKNLRSMLLTGALARTEVARIRKYGVRRFIRVKTGINLYPEVIPVSRRYLDVARRAGLAVQDAAPRLPVPEAEASSDGDGSGARVVLVPGAGFATKRWPIESFVELAECLVRTGRRVIVLGGAEEAELGRRMAAVDPSIADLTGKLTLPECLPVLRSAERVVTNDTGLLHMAEAVGTPVVALFGSSVAEFGFAPFLPGSRLLESPEVPCRPCSHIGRHACPQKHFACMREISVESVMACFDAADPPG